MSVVVGFIFAAVRTLDLLLVSSCWIFWSPSNIPIHITTPPFSNVFRLGVMCGVEKVSQLLDHPVMSLFGTLDKNDDFITAE
jgi:hypothetical protein